METRDPFLKIPANRKEVPIRDCGEPLVSIPNDGRFVFADPHPYQSLGAPYGEISPFSLRTGVLQTLVAAAKILHIVRPGLRLKIYDAYRPVSVQRFMVDLVALEYCRRASNALDLTEIPSEHHEAAYLHAHELWAPASDDVSIPPPHSTGAAIDCTIVDANGYELEMGSEIDAHENAHPDSFDRSKHPNAGEFRKNREFLKNVMEGAGFVRLRSEWWHFSSGDQHAVFERFRNSPEVFGPDRPMVARYGRI